MKPRVFLGSSVEGLSVAYSIQSNLNNDCEITVWSQGVFELSKTTIESLTDILMRSDFGIFVFTPDDLVRIRDIQNPSIRDNVLFEFGLFIGKLGRERVFFIIPSEQELHLPTDLLGITPGKYESDRKDGNLPAATAVTCHQISTQIKKLGPIEIVEESASTPVVVEDTNNNRSSWLDDYINDNFAEAITKLEKNIKDETDENDKIELGGWKAFCEYKNNGRNIKFIDEFLNTHVDNQNVYFRIAKFFLWEDLIDRCVEILEDAKAKFGVSIEGIFILSDCHIKNGDKGEAIASLTNDIVNKNVNLLMKLCSVYEEEKDFLKAREIIHKAYLLEPNNETMAFKYSKIATELGLHKLSLFFLDKLATENPKVSNYLGYLGNTCVNLDLYDIALSSYQKANEINNGKQEWIVSNIGNILKNKGFYSEAITYLRKGIQLDESSEYAHNRLSSSLKFKEEEFKLYKSSAKDGRKLLKEFSANLALANATIDITISE